MGYPNQEIFEKNQLKPAGDPRSDAIRAKGAEATKRAFAFKRDIRLLSEELINQLLLPLNEKGEVVSPEDVKSLKELCKENTNKRAVTAGISKLVERFAEEGDKRAVTQIVEILSAVSDAREADHNDGFLEALGKTSADDWGEDE